jgi:hypothetical protein
MCLHILNGYILNAKMLITHFIANDVDNLCSVNDLPLLRFGSQQENSPFSLALLHLITSSHKGPKCCLS